MNGGPYAAGDRSVRARGASERVMSHRWIEGFVGSLAERRHDFAVKGSSVVASIRSAATIWFIDRGLGHYAVLQDPVACLVQRVEQEWLAENEQEEEDGDPLEGRAGRRHVCPRLSDDGRRERIEVSLLTSRRGRVFG